MQIVYIIDIIIRTLPHKASLKKLWHSYLLTTKPVFRECDDRELCIVIIEEIFLSHWKTVLFWRWGQIGLLSNTYCHAFTFLWTENHTSYVHDISTRGRRKLIVEPRNNGPLNIGKSQNMSKYLAHHSLEVFCVVFRFWWGPLGSWVSDPPPGVKDGVSRCWKVGLCADLQIWYMCNWILIPWK